MPGIMCTLLPRGADGKRWQILLKPANLVLVVGSAVVATGLTGAPELNGRMGNGQRNGAACAGAGDDGIRLAVCAHASRNFIVRDMDPNTKTQI